MVKLPKTIYRKEISEALSKGVHELPYGLLVRAFKEEGYGEEKAKKWVLEMVFLHDHKKDGGFVKF